jgi:catechol 2,3-dioxygenase-like lactoylglutathione lyase family enzyme
LIGLSLVARDKERVILATKRGHEAVVLERGEAGQLSKLAFQVAPGSDLGEIGARLKSAGISFEHRSDITPGVAKAIAFRDPKGTLLEIYADYTFAPDDGTLAGIMPQKFGHVACRVSDVQKVTSFYTDMLGFRVSDWIGNRFSFLRCGADHHTANFVRYEKETLHHIAFEVKDWGELHRACDHLWRHNIQLVWGPIRHIVGHNIAAYHRNSDEVRVEIFAEMDLMLDEELGYFEPRPWHQDRPQRPKVWPDDTWRSQWGFGSFGTFPGYP